MTMIAIVEDERSLAGIVDAYLRREGFETCLLHDGTAADRWLRENEPDLVLLDVMLPGIDGLTICRSVRARSSVPIIMVTARADEVDRLLGLEIGADDYVCKPFSPREVVARVKAVLRRASQPTPEAIGHGLAIDGEGFVASYDGKPLDLTPSEFRLLSALSRRPGRVMSRTILLDELGDRDVFDRSVDGHVKNVRKKLAAAGGSEDMIQSIYGVGYRLDRTVKDGGRSSRTA